MKNQFFSGLYHTRRKIRSWIITQEVAYHPFDNLLLTFVKGEEEYAPGMIY